MGARRGREGNRVRTLIRPNGWRKVARSSAARQETVDEAEKEEREKEKRKRKKKTKNQHLQRDISRWTKRMRAPRERP